MWNTITALKLSVGKTLSYVMGMVIWLVLRDAHNLHRQTVYAHDINLWDEAMLFGVSVHESQKRRLTLTVFKASFGCTADIPFYLDSMNIIRY